MRSRSQAVGRGAIEPRCHTIDVRAVGDVNGSSRNRSVEPRTIASATVAYLAVSFLLTVVLRQNPSAIDHSLTERVFCKQERLF